MKRLNWCLSLAVVLIVIGFLSTPPAAAFDYSGQAWCCENVMYCVNPEEPPNKCVTATDRSFEQVIDIASATWTAYGSSFILTKGGLTNNRGCEPDQAIGLCISKQDGTNTVSMSSGCSFPTGVLATAWWWYTTNPGTGDNCCIFEADICFNRDENWYLGDNPADCNASCYDLESVALHEFGHWASLGHEDDASILGFRPVMFSTFNFCEMRRSLTPDDMAGIDYIYDPTGLSNVIVSNLRCDPLHSHPPYANSPKVPMIGPCEFTGCSLPCPPLCDSVTHDPCILICPASDIVFPVTIKDSCGSPICDMAGTWLDFSNCSAIPCPNEEPDWPLVYPDSCDPITGTHYFTVDASALDCIDCEAMLFVDGKFCSYIPAKFLDITGDLCVTELDWLNPPQNCMDFNCDGIIWDLPDSLIWEQHRGHCCTNCSPGIPNCDSITTDPCLLICPKSDIVWTATVLDSCGNPVCDPANLWLDFSTCSAIPCPGEEPNWPLVFPDSCDPLTGVHYFTVDAGYIDPAMLCDCEPTLVFAGTICKTIPARFLDITGDLCVKPDDWIGTAPCNDYDCDGVITSADQNIHTAHINHCCGGCTSGNQPLCDSLSHDECLLICPLGDEVFTVTLKDSCGNAICTSTDLWLDFSNCPSIPCDPHHPNWPIVYPDSCNPLTGQHYFSIYASSMDCIDCDVGIYLNGSLCSTVKGKFFDVDADGCVLQQDFFGGQPCADYDCDLASSVNDSLIFMSHLTHCCGGPCNDVNCDNGLLVTTFQVDGTKDDYVGIEPSSPGADLLPLLNCPLGMNNNFDTPITNQCFGHTFSGFWNTDCCILGGELCLKIRASGQIPSTDGLVFAENGVTIWGISMNNLISLYTSGSDTLWEIGDSVVMCLDLGNLPAWGSVTNVLGSLVDGDFDIKIQDDTEVDYLELRVDLCCPPCCLVRGNVDNIVGPGGSIDVNDLTYLVAYLFKGGPAPPCIEAANVDGIVGPGGPIDVSDLTYLVAYLFKGGPPPPPC